VLPNAARGRVRAMWIQLIATDARWYNRRKL